MRARFNPHTIFFIHLIFAVIVVVLNFITNLFFFRVFAFYSFIFINVFFCFIFEILVTKFSLVKILFKLHT